MYKSIHIQNFRGLTDLRIDDLGRVNLIVGANNVGKTSLLEALWLFSGADDPARAIELAEMRDYRPSLSAIAPAWRDLFQNMDVDRKIVIGLGRRGQRASGSVRRRVPSMPPNIRHWRNPTRIEGTHVRLPCLAATTRNATF